MKNYIKVVSSGRNVAVFPFDDADEVATRDAITRALAVAEASHGRVSRVVAHGPCGAAEFGYRAGLQLWRNVMSENVGYDRPDGGEWRCEARGEYSVLDHGYLNVVEHWGSDQKIIESARMSTDKGFLGWGPKCKECGRWYGSPHNPDPHVIPDHGCICGCREQVSGDEKLLRYLYEHKHSTPFEFAGLTIECQAPIMVYREWHRHRTQSYSEMSARYVQMPNLHYVPSVERIIASAKKSGNRQASGGGVLRIPDDSFPNESTPEWMRNLVKDVNTTQSEIHVAEFIRGLIRGEQQTLYKNYERLISFGVAKEVARLDTPVSRYSRMRATANLRNWLAFLTLRMDPNAQFEIRQYAWCVADVIMSVFPRTYELFNEGRLQ